VVVKLCAGPDFIEADLEFRSGTDGDGIRLDLPCVRAAQW